MNKKSTNSKERNIRNVDTEKKKGENQKEVKFQETPKICLLDIKDEIKVNLLENGFNVNTGTLGKLVNVPNEEYGSLSRHRCLPNHSFPANLHEYDIIVLDLSGDDKIEYEQEQHINKSVTGYSNSYILSQYPQTLFNPKPFGSYLLKSKLAENNNHPVIFIIFADTYEEIIYNVAKEINSHTNSYETKYNNYYFYPEPLFFTNKIGKKLIVQQESHEYGFYELLNKHIKEATYYVTFENPKSNLYPKDFIPLLKNSHNEAVSFLRFLDNFMFLVFPQIADKNSFLYELLTNQLPILCPTFFPFNTKFKWLEEKEYSLPNTENLLKEKESLIKEYEEKIERKREEIEINHKKYECLHCLLTESGNELVKKVKVFLEWLGFENVKIMDEQDNRKILEEDLRVEIEEGLLVIEVKGIGGTSTDAECSQIEKIKNRRARERNSFDVFGLYIVNHQRYRPPLIRENPPFKEQQIEDAKNDGRGLLTTWQLFNLYFSIKNECITKGEARKALLNYGLIEFVPHNCVSLGIPKDLYHKGEVVTLDLQNKIEINNELIIKRGSRYLKAKILGIKVHDNSVESVDSGPAGIEVNVPIKGSDELFIKK